MSSAAPFPNGSPEEAGGGTPAAAGAALDFREAARFLSEFVPRAPQGGAADDMQEVLTSILVRGEALEPRTGSAWRRYFFGALSNARRERARRARRIEKRLAELRELRRLGGASEPSDAEAADAAVVALLSLERDELECLLRSDWLGQTLRRIAADVCGTESPAAVALVFRRVRRARSAVRRALGGAGADGLRRAVLAADRGRLAAWLAELGKALRL